MDTLIWSILFHFHLFCWKKKGKCLYISIHCHKTIFSPLPLTLFIFKLNHIFCLSFISVFMHNHTSEYLSQFNEHLPLSLSLSLPLSLQQMLVSVRVCLIWNRAMGKDCQCLPVSLLRDEPETNFPPLYICQRLDFNSL